MARLLGLLAISELGPPSSLPGPLYALLLLGDFHGSASGQALYLGHTQDLHSIRLQRFAFELLAWIPRALAALH